MDLTRQNNTTTLEATLMARSRLMSKTLDDDLILNFTCVGIAFKSKK